MIRYAGLWGVALFCALSVLWTVLHSTSDTTNSGVQREQSYSFTSSPFVPTLVAPDLSPPATVTPQFVQPGDTTPPRYSTPSTSYRTFPNDAQQFAKQVVATFPSQAVALLSRYEMWKSSHSGPVETYINLYAPDVKIYQTGGTLLARQQLLNLAQGTRRRGEFDQVSDVIPPQVAVNGETAEIRARNRYGNSGDGSYSLGSRRLVWQYQHGEWVIVQDWFPDGYQQGLPFSHPQPEATPLQLNPAVKQLAH